jgi:hypothetical protein
VWSRYLYYECLKTITLVHGDILIVLHKKPYRVLMGFMCWLNCSLFKVIVSLLFLPPFLHYSIFLLIIEPCSNYRGLSTIKMLCLIFISSVLVCLLHGILCTINQRNGSVITAWSSHYENMTPDKGHLKKSVKCMHD